MNKPTERSGRVLFINAVDEVTRERSMSYLTPDHQAHVADAYHAFADMPGFSRSATQDEIHANSGNLSIPLYVRGKAVSDLKGEYATDGLRSSVRDWEESSNRLNVAVDQLLTMLTDQRP